MKKALAAVLLLGSAAGIAAAILARQPATPPQPQVFLEFPRGTATSTMARQLAAAGIVRSPWHFLAARLLHPSAKLQAGEYLFQTPATASEVLDRIARGDIYQFELTVPEGSNLFDVAEIASKFATIRYAEFLDAARNPELIRDIAPDAQTLEGYLFPSTYRLTRQTTAAALCQMMTREFRRVWRELSPREPIHPTVTLASLVEKEAQAASERQTIAGVFRNRLEKGMRMECDPTVIYAALLENRYRGQIYRSDLDNPHPYNTYQHAGLPPGPIANPGRASLEAAVNPGTTKYLYFVAEPGGTGRHVFSESLAAHSRAVGNYRRGGRQTATSRRTRSN